MSENSPPAGPLVDATPAQFPGDVTLGGCFGTVERLNASRHASLLWTAMRGQDAIWSYLPPGPFADPTTFNTYIAASEQNQERIFYTVLDNDRRAVGFFSLMEIRPAMRVIEVGNVVYAPALQRTPLSTEAQYLLARYAFERSATGATSGNATRSTRRRGARRHGSGSPSKASSVST